MPRSVNRLTARTVQTLAEPGRHPDGNGLYLVVDPSGAKRWVYIFRQNGKLREMGLGGVSTVSLAEAREAAAAARQVRKAGGDPILQRRAGATSAKPTFGKFADDFIETMKPQFRNEKHIAQWEMTLEVYAKLLRDLPIDKVGTGDVLKVLEPIWTTKPETANRLRGRIERVLDAAKAKGLRSGENPAMWKGHLVNLLPKRHRLTRGHHAALPYAELPAFMQALRGRAAITARALELIILTAARSGEVRLATWAEFDLEKALWIVPAERMKAGREHRVPLSAPAADLLKRLAVAEPAPADYVFPGNKRGRPISMMALDMLLRRLKSDVTTHGFRSTFRDWAWEVSDFPREVAEAALAHVIGDQTERAYRRGDALEKRRQLMDAWADYCAGASVAVGIFG